MIEGGELMPCLVLHDGVYAHQLVKIHIKLLVFALMCAELVGSHASTQWHACCYIPLHVIKNTAHLVFSMLVDGMDL